MMLRGYDSRVIIMQACDTREREQRLEAMVEQSRRLSYGIHCNGCSHYEAACLCGDDGTLLANMVREIRGEDSQP